jgi:uncharacterized membrane protein
MNKFLSLLVAAFAITACNSNQNQNSVADSNKAVAESIVPLDTTPRVFKGFYTLGIDVNIFQDCDDQKTYWVADSTSNLKKNYETAIQPLPYPNESIYTEVKGHLSAKAKTGPAVDYENVLVVTEIIKTEAKNFRTACYPYEFIALGNEPFWAVDIVPTTQQIILKDLSQDKVFVFPYQPANIGGGVHRFEATNQAKDKLVVIIRQEECSDGMSDRVYNYSAEVVINGRTLKGCAVKKGEAN